MYGNYNTYKRGFVNEYRLLNESDVQPMQFLTFDYKDSSDNLVISLGDFPNNKYLHCLKCNDISINEFLYMTTRFKDQDMINIYVNGIRNSVIDEVLKINSYKLPFINPLDIGSKNFYETYIKKNQVALKYKTYRTYKISDLKNIRIIEPDLRYYKLIPKNVQIKTLDKFEKEEFLLEQERLIKGSERELRKQIRED